MSRMRQPEISQPLLDRNLRGARQPRLSHRARQPDRMVEGEHRAFQEHDPRGRAHHRSAAARPRRGARHRPPAPAPTARTSCAPHCGNSSIPAELDGIISMHLLESDPELSKPITDDPSAPNPGAGDWFVLIDGTRCRARFRQRRGALHRKCRVQAAGDIGRQSIG